MGDFLDHVNNVVVCINNYTVYSVCFSEQIIYIYYYHFFFLIKFGVYPTELGRLCDDISIDVKIYHLIVSAAKSNQALRRRFYGIFFF